MNVETVQTTRLTLRPLKEGDAGVLHRIYRAEGVLQYFPNPIPPSLEQVERFIRGQQAHWQQHGYGNWAVVPKGRQEIIGWAGLQYLPELNDTEVGFLLDSAFWGRGYATEAAQASLHFGFEHLNLNHIIALVHPGNLASRRVLKKCRMQFVENLRLWGIELQRYSVSASNYLFDKPSAGNS